jgi:methionine-rich copper-binding protein CopC
MSRLKKNLRGFVDILIQNKALIKEWKIKSSNIIMFAAVIFALFIIFSSGIGNVSAAPVAAISTNASSGSSGVSGTLVSSNVVTQNINMVKANVTRPTVNTTDPAHNAVNVPINKTINITFTEPIKLGSNPWIEFKTGKGVSVPFAATVNGNVLFIAHSNLAYGENYDIILHGSSVTDISGIGMTLYSTNFTTITRPIVISSNPSNNAVNIPTKKVIQIKFNRSIEYGNSSGIQFINSKGVAIPFNSTISGSTLNITPASLLAHGTQYTIILHTNSVKDLAGNGITVCSTKFTTIVTTKTVTAYGVTFNYPATWVTEKQTQDGTNLIFVLNPKEIGQNAPQAIMQIMSNPSGMSDAEAMYLIETSTYPTGFKVLSKKMITLNGIRAYDTLYTINNKDMYTETMENQEIDIVKNNKTYSLDLIAPVKEFNSVKTNFDIIISSLKIS